MSSNNIENKIKYIENAIEILLKDESICKEEKTASLKMLEKRKTSLYKQLNVILSFPPLPPCKQTIANVDKTPIQSHKAKSKLEIDITHYIENVIIDTSIQNTTKQNN